MGENTGGSADGQADPADLGVIRLHRPHLCSSPYPPYRTTRTHGDPHTPMTLSNAIDATAAAAEAVLVDHSQALAAEHAESVRAAARAAAVTANAVLASPSAARAGPAHRTRSSAPHADDVGHETACY